MSGISSSPAAQRINGLLDPNSFVELGAFVTARSTDFAAEEKKATDGVITGHGLIDGRTVFVYSQDPSVMNGTIGEMHAKKIMNIYDMALRMGAPVIGIIDSKGVRLEESVDVLESIGALVNKAVKASGVIPQITVVYEAGGGLSALTAVSDFTFVPEKGKLFVSAPNAIKGNSADKCDTSSAEFQFAAGNAGVTGTEDEVLAGVRELLSFLPDNSLDGGCFTDGTDDLNRAAEISADMTGDAKAVATEIADDRKVFEIRGGYAPEMFTGFIKLDGVTVGVVGNQGSAEAGAVLTPHACEKAASFVKFLDAFDIPVITLTNVEGYEASIQAEKCMLRQLGRMASAFADATVPKINLITKSALGTAYIFFNAKSLGADLTYAYPDADMGIMAPASAAKIIAGSDASKIADAQNTYIETQYGVGNAARRGYIDRIVNPADTRKYLIAGLSMLIDKNSEIYKKHGTK